ncbi:MAG: PKD domain-containing protein [Candidatus Thermoplasmatota archaeon]
MVYGFIGMKKLIACMAILILLQALSGCIAPEKIEIPEKYVLKAILKIEPQIAYPNQTIKFDASETKGDIEEYWWNFNFPHWQWQIGDKIMSYNYSEPGIYKVALKVIDKNRNESAATSYVYINYQATIFGKVEKSQKNDTYIPIDFQVRGAVITLEYLPNYMGKLQLENLDLSAKVKRDENYTYVKSDNTTPDNGRANVELTRDDILFNAYGNWYAEVYYNITAAAPGQRQEIDYTLKIELYYNP